MKRSKLAVFLTVVSLIALAGFQPAKTQKFTDSSNALTASAPQNNCEDVAAALKILDDNYPKQLNHADLLNSAIKGIAEKVKDSGLGVIYFNPIYSSETDKQAIGQYNFDEMEALKFAGGHLTKCDIEFAATEAMLLSVHDSHVYFLSPAKVKMWQEESSGKMNGGVGISLRYLDGGIYAFGVMPNSPAEKAGIKRFDKILAVDGYSWGEISLKNTPKILNEIVGRIRGPDGTEVMLTVKRPKILKPINITITRGQVDLPLVESRIIDSSIGYIEIPTFLNLQTGIAFAMAFGNLMFHHISGLIIDVRGNTGGYLANVFGIIGLLLPPNTELLTETSRQGSAVDKVDSSANSMNFYKKESSSKINSFNIPVVILTDEMSASASEILSSAIKEHKRGITIGEKTAGALEIARKFPLPGGSEMSVTVDFLDMLMANGQFKPIEKVGVTPTISVKLSGSDFDRGIDSQLDAAIKYLEKFYK